MTGKKEETSGDELIEAQLEKSMEGEPGGILGENGLLADLKKRVVEKALAGELTHHLG